MKFDVQLAALILVLPAIITALCPDSQQSAGNCSDSSKENCTYGYICYKGECCPNCLIRVSQLTSQPLRPGSYTPQCDVPGTYLSEQCHYSMGQCWCSTEFGEEIPNTRIGTSVSLRGRRDCEQELEKFIRTKKGGANYTREIVIISRQPTSREKPGECPLLRPGQFGSCLLKCMVDIDCPVAGFKCCNNGCGRECKPAVFNETNTANSTPSPADFSSDNKTCGTNTILTDCASPCPLGCNELMGPLCEASKCEPGCECIPGYVRLRAFDPKSPCVDVNSCPAGNDSTLLHSLERMCNDTNSVWSDCGTACPETCQGKQTCGIECVSGCFCKPGYIRESASPDASCVAIESCPFSPIDCSDPNSEWSKCGTSCEETCLHKPTACTEQCVTGCFCKNGYVKESNSTDATCIAEGQCKRVQSSQPIQQQECPDPNSEWTECGNPCEETCQISRPDVCKTLPCMAACFCKPGYVRQSNDARSKCIPKSDCKETVVSQANIQVCPDPNAVYFTCGTACEETCSFRPTVCTRQCVAGCFCKPGFVKESTVPAAVCMPREQCFMRPQPTPIPTCQDRNALFSNCGTACQETCQHRSTECNSPCVSGCFCKDGFVKENSALTTASCIPKSQCVQSYEAHPSRCPDPNASWTNCGTACPGTCLQPFPQICTMQCVPGCFCNEGFVKETNAPNARCILKSMCGQTQTVPPQRQQPCADPNSVWRECGSACEETCQSRPSFCTMQCISGCYCIEGFVKESNAPNARCIQKTACPPISLKPGTCPAFTMNPYFGQPARQNQCRSDNDCQSIAKCCNSLTGLICMAPSGSEANQHCGSNEEYSPCPPPPQCVRTCNNYKSPLPHCNFPKCGLPGCQCRAGYVVNVGKGGRKECIQPHLCFSVSHG